MVLPRCGSFGSAAQAKRNVLRGVKAVAEMLGNTAGVCRNSYIDPRVIDAYLTRTLERTMRMRSSRARGRHALRPEETALLKLLRRRAPPSTST
jgi:DNA topoisomerase-1